MARRTMVKHVFLSFLFFLGQIALGWAQSDSTTSLTDEVVGTTTSSNLSYLPNALQFANTGGKLPEDLLHTKSAVFVDMIDAPGTSWKELAHEVHPAFDELGIDAVAYYSWRDANAGPDATRKLAKELNQRYIENIIYLGYHQPSKEYVLLIAPFDTEDPFVNRQQGAFQLVAGTPQTLQRQLSNVVRRSGIEKQNFLVIDVPEFFIGAGNVVRGNRAEGFAQDLKLDKLAVPRFGNEQDSALQRIMQPYPYEYALVDPERAEDDLRQDGYQYILLNLHTQEANIKNMLGYRDDSSQESTSSANKTTDTSAGPSVYKFYVKHIYTGDVYVGDTWDASPSWQTALTKYLRNMRDDMSIGQ